MERPLRLGFVVSFVEYMDSIVEDPSSSILTCDERGNRDTLNPLEMTKHERHFSATLHLRNVTS